MRVLSIISLVLVSACSTTTNDSYVTASQFVGLDERNHRSEIRELTGVDPVRTEWCAAFVNAVLELDGIPSLNDQTRLPPLMARSFLHWGEPVEPEDIQRGDLVIFPRGNQGWQGHVGFYAGSDLYNGRTHWIILGGNQDNTVNYQYFDSRRAIGVRRWPTD